MYNETVDEIVGVVLTRGLIECASDPAQQVQFVQLVQLVQLVYLVQLVQLG